MKRKCIGLVMGLLTSLAGMAVQTWTIQNSVVDGMTPSQQITNAVTRAANGDTILFKESADPYQLDNTSFMQEQTSGTITRRSYVYLTNKALNFVGENDGKWNDGVVLRGNGRERFFFVNNNDGSTFRNLTFENFASSNDPTVNSPGGDNAGGYAVGGAGFFATYRDVNVLSNCVFRDNVGRTGGAVGCANAFDCLFTNNVAKYLGGTAFNMKLARCSLVDNKADANASFGGAVHLLLGATDSYFAGNKSGAYGGAFSGNDNAIVSNCVFSGNSTTISSLDNGSGVMVLKSGSKVVDSSFFGNFTQGCGGVIRTTSAYTAQGSVFERCAFTNNYATSYNGGSGGVVYDGRHAAGNPPLKFLSCTFAGNYYDSNNSTRECGVAYCGAYSNCTFIANNAWSSGVNGIISGTSAYPAQIIDCEFSANTNRNSGMVRYAYCTNTIFRCNYVPGSGGVVKRCNVIDCRFVGNYKAVEANTVSGDATESTCVKCDMDLGYIVNSVLIDCHVHTLTNNGAMCVFYGHNVATNCLIESCTPPDATRGLVYRWGPIDTAYVDGSDYVNCTFADNVFDFMYHHTQESGIYTPFKNCLFYNNRNSSGALIDARYKVNDAHWNDHVSLDSGLALSNCVFGTAVSSGIAGDTWQDLGGNKIVAPANIGLAGAKAAELRVNNYSPLLKSPVCGMGDASMFTDFDRDYAGNLRLRDGLLDAGCFQCWLRPPGMLMIVR